MTMSDNHQDVFYFLFSFFSTDQQDLIKYLFSPKRYCPEVRPNAGNGPVTVTHRYNLLRLVNFVSDPILYELSYNGNTHMLFITHQTPL